MENSSQYEAKKYNILALRFDSLSLQPYNLPIKGYSIAKDLDPLTQTYDYYINIHTLLHGTIMSIDLSALL